MKNTATYARDAARIQPVRAMKSALKTLSPAIASTISPTRYDNSRGIASVTYPPTSLPVANAARLNRFASIVRKVPFSFSRVTASNDSRIANRLKINWTIKR